MAKYLDEDGLKAMLTKVKGKLDTKLNSNDLTATKIVDTLGDNAVKKATSATSADSATKATQDGDGKTISSTYAKLTGATFTSGIEIANGTGDDYVRVSSGLSSETDYKDGKIYFKGQSGEYNTLALPEETSTLATQGFVLGKNYLSSVPKATTSALGGVMIGYSANDKNYPLTLDTNGKAYVNVPWTDTTYTLPTATSSKLGGVKSSTTGTTSGRDYNVQVNADGTMKVNVPWTDTTYTLPVATSTVRGGIKIGYATSGKNYPVQLSNEKAYVNVPWTDTTYTTATSSANGLMSSTDKAKLDGIASNANNYSLPKATSSTFGGVKLGSDTIQTVGANSVSSTASRTYAVQKNSSDQLVVNVPWTDSGSGQGYAKTAENNTFTGTNLFTKPITIENTTNDYIEVASGQTNTKYRDLRIEHMGQSGEQTYTLYLPESSGMLLSDTLANSYYVKKAGDTMTGALKVNTINNTSGTAMMAYSNSAVNVGNSSYATKLLGSATRPTYNGNDLALYSDIPSTLYTHIIRIEIDFTNGNSIRVCFSFVCNKSSLITSYTELREILINNIYHYTADGNIQTGFPASGNLKNNGTFYNAYAFGYNVVLKAIALEARSPTDGSYSYLLLGETITGYSKMTFNDCMYKTNV